MRNAEISPLPPIWDQGEYSESVREYLKRAFDLDFPISGEWGYTTDTPVVFEYSQDDIPVDYIALERAFVEKRIYSECIVFRPKDDRFSGIEWQLESSRLLNLQDRKIDELTFHVKMLADDDFEMLKADWEKNYGYEYDPPASRETHMRWRSDLTYHYTSVFFFDVTTFFPIGTLKLEENKYSRDV